MVGQTKERTREFDPAAIAEIVRGLDPVDWVQMELLARLSLGRRILAGMGAQAFAMAMLRGTFAERFPELTRSELNMKVLVLDAGANGARMSALRF